MFLAHRVYMATACFTRGYYQPHPSRPGCVADNPPRRAGSLPALQNRISNGTHIFFGVPFVLSILTDVTTVYRIFLPPKNGLLTGSHNNQASLMLRNSFPKTQVEPSFRLRISCSAAPLPRRLLLPIKQPRCKLIWKQQSGTFHRRLFLWNLEVFVPFLPNSVFSSLSPPTSHSRPITIPLAPLSSREHRGHEIPLPVLAHSSLPCASS